jgi:hypothetical protein
MTIELTSWSQTIRQKSATWELSCDVAITSYGGVETQDPTVMVFDLDVDELSKYTDDDGTVTACQHSVLTQQE